MRLSLALFCFLISIKTFSQNFIGLGQSNYAGVLGIQQNPASFQNGKLNWDINLAGFGTNFYTEAGYVANESWLSLIGKSNTLNASDSLPFNYNPDKDALYYISRPSGNYTGLITNTTIYGPLSFAFKIKNWSVGLFNSHRVYAAALNTPQSLNYYDLKVIADSQTYRISDFSVVGMGWSEVGLHLGHRMVLGDDERFLSFGANIKYLLGYEAAFLENNTSFQFTRFGDSIASNYSNTEVGFASGRSTTSDKYNFGVKGTGFGLDLGVEYMVALEIDEDDGRPNNYSLKLGGSIRDLGVISFTENAHIHRFNINGNTRIYKEYLKNEKQIDNILRATSGAIYGDPNASKVSSEVSILLPTSLNLFADYQIYKNVYLAAMLSRRLMMNTRQLAAPNIMAITPRYESRWLEFGMPISLVEDNLVGLGAYARLGFLTIGTEHLSSILFKQTRLYQADIYLALKFNPFKIKAKEEQATSFGQGGRKGEVGCYKW